MHGGAYAWRGLYEGGLLRGVTEVVLSAGKGGLICRGAYMWRGLIGREIWYFVWTFLGTMASASYLAAMVT